MSRYLVTSSRSSVEQHSTPSFKDFYTIKTPLLTADEERELAELIRIGRDAALSLQADKPSTSSRRHLIKAVREGDEAKRRFIESNLKLVLQLAKRQPLPAGMDFDDLVQEGNLGLIRAVEKYDWRKGFRFSTYATFWIRQAVQRAVLSNQPIRIPEDVSTIIRSHWREDSPPPESSRLSHARAAMNVDSLDRPIGESGSVGGTLSDDDSSPEDVLSAKWSREFIEDALRVIDDDTVRGLLILRFGLDGNEPWSVFDLSRAFDLSPWMVNKLIRRGVSAIRQTKVALEMYEMNA